LAAQYPQLIDEVRGWGLINGLALKADAGFSSIDLVKSAMGNGLLLVPAGPQVVRYVPPLIVSAEEIDQALAATARALATLTAA
jgi:acetylornithine aminotransferase